MLAQNSNSPHHKGQGSGGIDATMSFDITQVLNYLLIIKERWAWGLTAGLIAAGLFAWMGLSKTTVYETTAYMLIESRAERIIDFEQVVDTSLSGKAEELDNHLRQLQSSTFRRSVVESFSEDERKLIQAAYIPKNPEDRTPSVGEIIGGGVGVGRNGQVFSIWVRNRSPHAAQLIANRYIEQYINNIQTKTGIGNESALVFLEQQAEELAKKITETERRLTDYRGQLNMVSLEDSQSIVVQRLNAIYQELTTARMEQVTLGSSIEQIAEAIEAGEDLTEIALIADFGTIPEMQSRKKAVALNRAELSLRYLERHPRMIEVEQRLMQIQEQLDAEVARAVRELNVRKSTVDRRIEHLTRELAEAEKIALNLDQQSIGYNVLRRQLESDRETFDSINSRLNETRLSSKLTSTNLRVLDEAYFPGVPLEPNPAKAINGAILLFVFCMVGVPLAVEFLDNRLKSAYDVEAFIGKPLISDIPYVKEVASGKLGNCVVLEDSNEPVVEAFRYAYSSYQYCSTVGAPKTILITSSRPAEGKTFFSANFAAIMAKHGLRCIIIDCDLRRPALHKVFGQRNDKGIIPWFDACGQGKIDFTKFDLTKDPHLDVQNVAEGLDFIRSGGSTNRTTELIDSKQFAELLRAARALYDVVILDTPPSSVFIDTMILSELADEILYVARYNKISRYKVRQQVSRLDKRSHKVTGIIINSRTSQKGIRYGSDYNYAAYTKDYKTYQSEQSQSPTTLASAKPVSRRART